MDDLVALWSAWWTGPLANSTDLWGKPLWWWARVGTVAQVVAIVGLAFELIGYQRLRLAFTSIWSAAVFRKLRSGLDAYFSDNFETGSRLLGYAFGIGSMALFWVIFAPFIVDLIAGTFGFWQEIVRDWSAIGFAWLMVRDAVFAILGTVMAAFAGAMLLSMTIITGLVAIWVATMPLVYLLKSPILRAALNVAILVATLFNVHFALLTQ